jgi:hypothetical protein
MGFLIYLQALKGKYGKRDEAFRGIFRGKRP